MKKILFSSIIIIALVLCIPAFATDDVVFVSANGSDDAVGTAEAPFSSFYAAFRALPFGGTVVVCDEISIVEVLEFPMSKGLITVTSVYNGVDYRTAGAKIATSANIFTKSAIKFENINFVANANNLVILCNGNYTCFGEGISVQAASDEINLLSITAGTTGAIPANGGYVEIHSGDWFRIRAGARSKSSAAHMGDTTLAIYGGTFIDPLYMCSDSDVDGNVNVYIYGGTFMSTLTSAISSNINGNLYVSIYGGDFLAGLKPTSSGNINGNCTINVCGGNLARIFNGSGNISGDISVNVADGISVSCVFDKNTLTAAELATLAATDAQNIENAKATKRQTVQNPFKNRNITDRGTTESIYVVEKAVAGGDMNGDGKIALIDVLMTFKRMVASNYDANADINEDGVISIYDAIKILRSALNGGMLIDKYENGNEISETLSLYGDISVSGDSFENGFVFSEVDLSTYSLSSTATLDENAVIGLYFGCDTASPSVQNGYYFEADKTAGKLTVYKIISGTYRVVAEKNYAFTSETSVIKLTYGTTKNAVQLYFSSNPSDAYFAFDLQFEPFGNGVGVYAENASATLPICLSEDTIHTGYGYYTNNLFEQFTDPEVFYSNRRYYFYGTCTSSQNSGIQCYSTNNFITWTNEGFVLAHGKAFGDGRYKAANIVKIDDLYYMFYMAYSEELGTSVTAYATSKSPKGPFSNSDKTALTSDSDFIGGQPFIDDDGKIYLIYARTTGGNKLYGAEITFANGKAEIDLSTEKLLLVPTEDWEYAKASVVECGFIVKHEGIYYMLYSGGNYNSAYGTGYATSTSPLGTYTKYENNPILVSNDQSFGVGAATVFVSPDGSEHFVAYIRNFSPAAARPLLTCVDRIRFVDNPNGGNDIIEISAPSVNPQKFPSGIGTSQSSDYQTLRWHW